MPGDRDLAFWPLSAGGLNHIHFPLKRAPLWRLRPCLLDLSPLLYVSVPSSHATSRIHGSQFQKTPCEAGTISKLQKPGMSNMQSRSLGQSRGFRRRSHNPPPASFAASACPHVEASFHPTGATFSKMYSMIAPSPHRTTFELLRGGGFLCSVECLYDHLARFVSLAIPIRPSDILLVQTLPRPIDVAANHKSPDSVDYHLKHR